MPVGIFNNNSSSNRSAQHLPERVRRRSRRQHGRLQKAHSVEASHGPHQGVGGDGQDRRLDRRRPRHQRILSSVLWLDPSIAEDPIWKEHWAGVEAVVVKVAEDSIVLEADGGEMRSADDFEPSVTIPDGISDEQTSGLPRERGRVKWFDAEKGYGFLIRPTGDDLFVHHSEVQGDPSELSPSGEVEYEVGRNDRGPNARSVRTVG